MTSWPLNTWKVTSMEHVDAHYNCTPDFWSPVSDRKRLPIGRRVFPSNTVRYLTLVTLGMWEVIYSLGRMYFCMEALYLQLEMWLPLLFCSVLLKYFLSHYSIIKTATPSERKCLKHEIRSVAQSLSKFYIQSTLFKRCVPAGNATSMLPKLILERENVSVFVEPYVFQQTEKTLPQSPRFFEINLVWNFLYSLYRLGVYFAESNNTRTIYCSLR